MVKLMSSGGAQSLYAEARTERDLPWDYVT